MNEPPANHDEGLAYDLAALRSLESRLNIAPSPEVRRMLTRRGAIKLLGVTGLGVGLMAMVGCGDDDDDAATATAAATAGTATATQAAATANEGTPVPTAPAATTAPAAATAVVSCDTEIPPETAGPYPGDGSNGPNVLNQSGVVRSDIRSSFGSSSGTADGIPLTIKLAIVDQANGCAPFAGAAAYAWHCDREGRYSLYSQGAEDQNYLRGVQAAGDDGIVTFQSIFPACYPGRWPHIHFEVYSDLASAADSGNAIATSQLALPIDASGAVYATAGYEQSVSNLSQVSLTSDNVFRDDGGERQLGTVTGSVTEGYVVMLGVPVSA